MGRLDVFIAWDSVSLRLLFLTWMVTDRPPSAVRSALQDLVLVTLPEAARCLANIPFLLVLG